MLKIKNTLTNYFFCRYLYNLSSYYNRNPEHWLWKVRVTLVFSQACIRNYMNQKSVFILRKFWYPTVCGESPNFLLSLTPNFVSKVELGMEWMGWVKQDKYSRKFQVREKSWGEDLTCTDRACLRCSSLFVLNCWVILTRPEMIRSVFRNFARFRLSLIASMTMIVLKNSSNFEWVASDRNSDDFSDYEMCCPIFLNKY